MTKYFAAKCANSDAHIIFAPANGHDGYEVVIGGWANTLSVIRDRKGFPHPGHAKTWVTTKQKINERNSRQNVAFLDSSYFKFQRV